MSIERAVVEVNELLGCYPDRIWRRKQIPDQQARVIWRRHEALRQKKWLVKPVEPVASEMKKLTENLSAATRRLITRRHRVIGSFLHALQEANAGEKLAAEGDFDENLDMVGRCMVGLRHPGKIPHK